MGDEITVAGMQKEQAELQGYFDRAREAFDEVRVVYETAKANLVKFNNKYGRVLEVLDSSE